MTAPCSCKDGEGEREVGQFPDASKEEALALYARRYLDLTAKLDLFANRLKSSNVKNREDTTSPSRRFPPKSSSRPSSEILRRSSPSSKH